MKNLYGITDIAVRAIRTEMTDMSPVNSFLEEYDGNIIDIQALPMLYGVTEFIITYKAKEN